jgi:2-C-methyl-D-erythritol 4-phosphate cytidylyltransferase
MTSAVIVAAGKGTRMGPNVDKLFLEIAGQPIVAWTWKAFDQSPEIDEILLVIREGMESEFEKIGQQNQFKKPFRFTTGGKERQNSVWNGLQSLSAQTQIVAIQDGARPCTSAKIISDTISAAREMGAAVAAQKVTDTLKEGDANHIITRNVDRSRLWSVQTPQVFRLEIIKRALQEVMQRNLLVTDDTAACELIHQPVRCVESQTPNPKLTSPADLPYFEFLLSASIRNSKIL